MQKTTPRLCSPTPPPPLLPTHTTYMYSTVVSFGNEHIDNLPLGHQPIIIRIRLPDVLPGLVHTTHVRSEVRRQPEVLYA